MSHIQTIMGLLAQQPHLCDDCLSLVTDIRPRQQIHRLCSGAISQIRRTKGNCARCKMAKLLNSLHSMPKSDVPISVPKDLAKKATNDRDRELRVKRQFNESIVRALGIANEDYYGSLDFKRLLELKAGLARIHDIVTLKLSFALVDWIAARFEFGQAQAEGLRKKVNSVSPNASGFDIDCVEPNIIGEVKGCIPVKRGRVFGSAQLRGLTADVYQMFGHPFPLKATDRISPRNKIYREGRDTAIKLLGMYDSPEVRAASNKWMAGMRAHRNWKEHENMAIEDIQEGTVLLPGVVYVVYLAVQ